MSERNAKLRPVRNRNGKLVIGAKTPLTRIFPIEQVTHCALGPVPFGHSRQKLVRNTSGRRQHDVRVRFLSRDLSADGYTSIQRSHDRDLRVMVFPNHQAWRIGEIVHIEGAQIGIDLGQQELNHFACFRV
jgi:hypothetical protein